MGTEVDAQRVLSCCFAASSSRTQSAMLCPIDCNILASADLALHIALTFSSGTRPNAGGVNRGSNTANNTKARFIPTPHAMRLRAREPIAPSMPELRSHSHHDHIQRSNGIQRAWVARQRTHTAVVRS